MPAENFVEVAKMSDFEDSKPLPLEIAGLSILLCPSDGHVFAIENKCSHAEEPLTCGRIRLGWISCPAHGARFDLETGKALNPPAKEPIRTFPVIVEGDSVFVDPR